MGTSRSLRGWTVVLAGTSLASVLALAAAPQAASQGASATGVPGGAALYTEHCASCHGASATGDGPMTRALKHAPPDLTNLSLKNNGVFPSARVHRIIEGRDIESHGDRDMPVWGDVFTRSRDAGDAERVKAVIQSLVEYLDSIQLRPAHEQQ